MDIRAWTGMQLLFVIVAYWALLALGWRGYRRRPGLAERQEAARAASHPDVRPNGHGGFSVSFEMTVNYTPAIVLVVVPPVLAILVWVVGSRV